jgi:hypothetical protein
MTQTHSPIDVSRDAANVLVGAIESMRNGSAPLIEPEVAKLHRSLTQFETVLAVDLRRTNAYIVTKKGIYNTTDLIEHAEAHLPIDITKYVDGASEELQSAGKCLAFELPTACAFHLLRAAESVMRAYYETLKGEALKERLPTWDAYIKKLTDVGADERILLVLSQVREKHRNPVMHPEEVLNLIEAQVLFGIIMTAITAMVMAIEDANDIPF